MRLSVSVSPSLCPTLLGRGLTRTKDRVRAELSVPPPSCAPQAPGCVTRGQGPRGARPPCPGPLSLSPLLPPGRWVAGPWNPCSATCEKGTQQREVTCVYQLQNGTHLTTRPLYCQGARPAPVQSCEGQDCLSIWEASEWSQVGAGPLSTGTPTWARFLRRVCDAASHVTVLASPRIASKLGGAHIATEERGGCVTDDG